MPMRWPEQMRGQRGVGGKTFAAIETSGVEEWLTGLLEKLVSKRTGLTRCGR
jgi:hypothetical protein